MKIRVILEMGDRQPINSHISFERFIKSRIESTCAECQMLMKGWP